MADTTVEEKNQVQATSSAYDDYMEVIDLPKTLMGGTVAMRNAGTTYLPREEGETINSYNNRKARSILLNAYKRTVQKLTGEVFSKPIHIGDDVPQEDIVNWLDDVDLGGKDITRFCKDVFSNSLAYGVRHILVDYQQVEKRTQDGVTQYYNTATGEWELWTASTEKQNGYRPYWIEIDAENVIGWRTEVKNGRTVLSQVRIRETAEEADGKYGTKEVERIRVLEPGTWELWQKNEQTGQYDLHSKGTTSLDFIPLHTFMPGEAMTLMTAQSPLDGLAWLNLMHWQSSSDQRNILHYARFPLWFGKQLDANEDSEEIEFGPNRLIHSNSEFGDLKAVEHSGSAISAGRQDLEDLKTEMAMFGLTFLMPRTGDITATEKAINSSENTSALMGWALAFEDFLNEVINTTGLIVGKGDGESGSVTVNKEFSSMLNDLTTANVILAYEKGIIPREVAIEELKRRGTIRDDWDFVEIQAMMENEQRQNAGAFGALAGNFLRPETTAQQTETV